MAAHLIVAVAASTDASATHVAFHRPTGGGLAASLRQARPYDVYAAWAVAQQLGEAEAFAVPQAAALAVAVDDAEGDPVVPIASYGDLYAARLTEAPE